MQTIYHFLSINTIFFTVMNYPMSYIEFFGTIFNLWSVWLVARNNVWNWPIGNIGVVLFAILFYQINLYSDLGEQVYYFITGFYGWYMWLRIRKNNENTDEKVEHESLNVLSYYAVAVVLLSIALGFAMSRINIWLPAYFPEPASYPYLDAFTTVLSFAATVLMIYKKVECWYLWILVDVIGIWLYNAKGVTFIALLYAVFLVLATKGLFNWLKIYNIPLRQPKQDLRIINV